MSRDAARYVAEQVLTIFKAHSGGTKASTEGVLQIVDTDLKKTSLFPTS